MSNYRYKNREALVAAPDLAICRLLLGHLEELGLSVVTVKDGVSVMEQMADLDFQVVFLSLDLLNRNAFDTSQLIEDAWPPALKPLVFGLTSQITSHLLDSARLYQMDDVFPLDISIDALSQKLEEHFSHRVKKAKPAQEPTGIAIFEPESLGQLLKTYDRSLLSELAASYLNSFLVGFTRLKHLIEQGNHKAAREQAHQLKGSGAALCVRQPTRYLAIVERDIGYISPLQLTELMGKIEALIPQLKGAVKKQFLDLVN